MPKLVALMQRLTQWWHAERWRLDHLAFASTGGTLAVGLVILTGHSPLSAQKDAHTFTIDASTVAATRGVKQIRVTQQFDRYEVDVVGRNGLVMGHLQIKSQTDRTSLHWRDYRTSRELMVRYGDRMQWTELVDPQTGKRGKSRFIDSDGTTPPRHEKDATFKAMENSPSLKAEFELVLEIASMVLDRQDSADADVDGGAFQMATTCDQAAAITAVAGKKPYSCNGSTCRGASYGSMSRSGCCELARSRAHNCCSFNAYCIGCCGIGSCDAHCTFGDYLCSPCGVTGRRCSAPV